MTRNLPVLNRYSPPATRGECIAGTANTGSLEQRLRGEARCGALHCRVNLDRVDAEDVPGRRNNGRDPEWTMTERGDAFAPSCALDVAMRGAQRCGKLAVLFGDGKQKRRWQQEVRGAVFALKDAMLDSGMHEEEVYGEIKKLLDLIEQERMEG